MCMFAQVNDFAELNTNGAFYSIHRVQVKLHMMTQVDDTRIHELKSN